MTGNDSVPLANARVVEGQPVPSFDFGICLRDHAWKIKYQNLNCISICGNQVGKVCQETCSRLTRKSRFNLGDEIGIESFRQKQFGNDVCDVAIIHSGDTVTSVLSKLEFSNSDQERSLRKFGLTARELEIYVLRKRGFKNIEIEHLLKISRCTLKTHIRHILKKLKQSSTSL